MRIQKTQFLNPLNPSSSSATTSTSALPLTDKSQPNYSRWFFILVILHLTLWTIIPTLLRHSLPMDALEGFVWGQTWQLGYDRNPWLNAWLTHFAVIVGGRSGWLVYFLSQLSVIACFFAVWRLGKKILHPLYALIAVFMLEAIQYYSLAAIDFNDNVLEIGLWALLTLCFYNALIQQKIRDWLLVGFLAALSLMAKYYAAVLFLPMLILLLLTQKGRKSFAKIGFYLGIATFLIIIAPHFIWLLQHNLITLKYALARVSKGDWQNSWWYFAFVQFLAFLAPIILFFFLWIGKKDGKEGSEGNSKKILLEHHCIKVNNFAKIFLLIMAMGPFFTTILLSIAFNTSLHVMWGTPLLSWWSLALITLLQPKITKFKFNCFVSTIFAIFFGILIVYSYNIIYQGYASSAAYPGKNIAAYIDNQWNALYQQKPAPAYVIGDRYTAGNVAYFSKYKLKACIWDNDIYSCDSDDKVQKKGAIFVWRADGGDRVDGKVVDGNLGDSDRDKAASAISSQFIDKIKQRFKSAKTKIVFTKDQIKSFYWIYNPNQPPLTIGIAFLPAE